MPSQVGLIGLGTMGAALARNLASRGYKVSVWNRTHQRVTDFIQLYGEGSFYGAEHVEDFVESLEQPRKIILMLPAGAPTEEVLNILLPALAEGDVLMDGGNAHFKDTERFQSELKERGVLFLGTGISGGERGALIGPSLMPGGPEEAWRLFEPILSKIAAEDFEGKACVAYMGQNGAGHCVKMVHNGIEYAEMQAFAEAYDLLSSLYKLSQEEVAAIFERWKHGALESFILDISIDLLKKRELTGEFLLPHILDKAGQKGTGLWTSQEALDLGVPTPSITAAVFARGLSQEKDRRVALAPLLASPEFAPSVLLADFVTALEQALILARLSHFAQGLELLKAADKEYGFGLNLGEILRVWQGGCIIRARILKELRAAVVEHAERHLFEDPRLQVQIKAQASALRTVVATAAPRGVPLLVLSADLAYLESYRRAILPAHFIQGLRDRFGLHGFERTDCPGTFHGDWL